jgi:outer membrane protein assembly factor BamB
MKKALLAVLLLAPPAQAGLTFGLGKGAAKRAAAVIEKAVALSTPTAPASGSGGTGRLKWSVTVNETFNYSSPAISSSGVVYVASSHHFVYYNGYWSQGQKPPAAPYGLYAFNPDGSQAWKYSDGADAPARGSPVIGPDGTIYIVLERLGASQAATSEELHAVNPDGTRKWKTSLCNCYSQIGTLAPSVAADGTIYATGNGLTAFNPADGSVKWTAGGNTSPTSIYFASPVVAHDGTVWSVMWPMTGGQQLRSFDPSDGHLVSTSTDLGTYPISCAPAIAADGTVYLGIHDYNGLSGAANGALLAFTSTGSLKWAFPAVDFDVRSQPSVDFDGTVYFGTKGNNGFVYALNPDGTEKWHHATVNDISCPGCGTDVYDTPAIGQDGTIYVANELSAVYAFKRDGTVLWMDDTLAGGGGFTESSADLAADGTLYIATAYGKFIAVNTASLGLSGSAQVPRFHYDTASSGRQP